MATYAEQVGERLRNIRLQKELSLHDVEQGSNKEFKASVRNIPSVDEYDGAGKCILTGETVDRRVVIAKAY